MKRKVNINRKPLASEEINATKDFGSLVSKMGGASQVSPKPKGNATGWLIGGIAAVAIVTGIYFGTKNTTPATQETNPVIANQPDTLKQKAPVINPLLAQADIKNESYKVDADKGGKIKHHTGTEITIPEGAFMDEEGNIITGKVEVQYREFHDQADIFLSGISMKYDSAGKERIFESAGMMEIRGFKDGKRLKIVPDKNFRICMHSKNPDPKFNLYYLDEEKKKWDYEGKDSITEEPEIKEPIDYDEFTNSGLTSNEPKKMEIVLTDSTNVNVKVIPAEKKDEIEIAKEEVKIIKQEIKKIKKTEPNKPVKANPEKKNFSIDVVKSEFPELETYNGTIFEVTKNEDLPEDTYSVTWNDMKLKQKNKTYTIQLSKDERIEEFSVIPVLDEENYENAKKIFDSKFGEYKTKLKDKEAEEKIAEQKLAKLKKAYTKQKEEYARSIAKMKRSMTATQKGNFEMQRVFSIRKFGTWNCDSPVKPPKGMLVQATYIDKASGEEIRFKRLDLIEKNRNACFPLDFVRSVSLSFNPRRNNYLWGVTEDGMIAVAKEDEFDGIERNQRKHTFRMQLIDITGKSSAEIKKLIMS
ncbi:MAG: hypothetical protein ACPGVD_10935 [Flavobacteriales bacterium]